MNKDYFHQRIKETIEECAYEFFLVHPIEEVSCTCINHTTKQPDPKCGKCLGTGFKIRIKKIKGASNEVPANVGASRNIKGSAVDAEGRTYFIDEKYHICRNDIFVDGQEVFYAYRKYRMKAFGGTSTHFEVEAIPKRNDTAVFVENFNKIMERHNRGKK